MKKALVLALLAPFALADHPLERDKTGIEWVYPFKKAWKKAQNEKRPLLLLPLAGGGGRNPGNW